MKITLDLGSLRVALSVVLALIIGLGFIAEYSDRVLQLDDPFGLIPFFGLSYEANLPTWFASALLLLCALMLACISQGQRQAGGTYTGRWWLLTALFLYISVDEFVQIHEEASNWLDFEGILYFSWVVPAALVVAILGCMYLPLVLRLPVSIRKGFVVAGGLYVGGALGVELALGYWTDQFGLDGFGYAMIDLVEESMELAGASIFLYTLIKLLALPRNLLLIRVVDEGADAACSPALAARR